MATTPSFKHAQNKCYPATFLLLLVTLFASVALVIVAIQALGGAPHWAEFDVSRCASTPCTLLSLEDFKRLGVNLDLTVIVDPLSAFFLLLIGGLSVAISLFSFQFLRSEPDHTAIAFVYLCFLATGVLFV